MVLLVFLDFDAYPSLGKVQTSLFLSVVTFVNMVKLGKNIALALRGHSLKGTLLLQGPNHHTSFSMGTNSLFMYFKNLLQQKFVAQITSSSHSSIVNDKNLQS